MCAQIRVWHYLVTDRFGLFTEIAVCKFLSGLVQNLFYFVHCMCLEFFFIVFVRRIVLSIWLEMCNIIIILLLLLLLLIH